MIPARPRAYLRQGFLSNALNPKVALFFFALLYLAWFGLYVAAVDRLGRWVRRPNVKARIEQVTGLVLLTVAVRLTANQ